MSFIIRTYGKSELYHELSNMGYSYSYQHFRSQLYHALQYTGDQLEHLKRRRSLTPKEVKCYIEECGLPHVFE